MKKESVILRFLYGTLLGRFLLKGLTTKFVSQLGGFLFNTHFSKVFINSFVHKNKIHLEDYYQDFTNFNDFFSRKIYEELRPIDKKSSVLISPSDGRLSVYKIQKGLVLPIKQSYYSISSLLQNEELASFYENGICLVFRLCVDNYHRYCYIDSGTKEENVFIPGKLHTVRPIALEKYPVFVENAREYTVLNTEHFGKVVQIEVGALFVGKIQNYHEKYTYLKGEEKGKFLYGGSTIVLLVQENAVKIPDFYFKKTKTGEEIPIKMGEKIGEKE